MISVVKEKITLEYVMLRGINDNSECAKQLIKLMAQFPCKVNLIEFNPWPGVQYLPTKREEMEKLMTNLIYLLFLTKVYNNLIFI